MSELAMRRPVCEGAIFFPGTEIFDDRYGEPNRYQLARCGGCGDLPGFFEPFIPVGRPGWGLNDIAA